MNQKFYAIRSPILCGCSVGLVWGKGEGVVVVKHFFFMIQVRELILSLASDYLLMHTYPELIMNRGINLIGPHGCVYNFVLISTPQQPSILTSSFLSLAFLFYQI